MPLGLDIDRNRLVAVCRRYHVAALELFGSRAKGTATPESDVDLLVTFTSPVELDVLVTLADELEAVFEHPVDLLTRASVEASINPIKRRAILDAAESVYAAA